MSKFIVYAERVILEYIEVEAATEQQAKDQAIEADSNQWIEGSDIDWQVTRAVQAVE